VPKGPVYEWATPSVHRSGVTAIDVSDPAGTDGAVTCAGYQCCQFDITISGTDFQSLDLQALFWNSRLSQWFAGAKYQLTATGKHALVVDARGAIIFLKVTAFSGTSFSLSADYMLG
jgi:hypothetical protein